jgi:hypothetical protein
MSEADAPLVLSHPCLGECRLERIEGMTWVLRDANNRLLSVPVSRRREFSILDIRPMHGPSAAGIVPPAAPPPALLPSADQNRLRRMFESIRTGLPPADGELRHLAVGVQSLDDLGRSFLEGVCPGHGAVRIVRGAYGHGKSFALRLLQADALQKGFLVARTEIDASENQLNKPHHVYRDLMRNLRIPGSTEGGSRALAQMVHSHLCARALPSEAARVYLQNHIECRPLAWLLSDLALLNKEELLGLLAADPNVPPHIARKTHVLSGQPRDWPKFTAGTQGDFASYVLSGVGKVGRLLGFKGLVVIIDEMEKWQDLHWRAQTQAGNLIGGLIWAATGTAGNRQRGTDYHPNPAQPEALSHSLLCGGYPFTTESPCHMGLVIAMTPRGDEGPEEMWRHYGPLEFFDLPPFTTTHIRDYLARVTPDYCAAYGVPAPDLSAIEKTVVSDWLHRSDGSVRSGVQSAVAVLDAWRDSCDGAP